jgi:hypothetical protein
VQRVPAIDLDRMAGRFFALPVFVRQAMRGGIVTLERITVLSGRAPLARAGRSRPIEHPVLSEAGQFVAGDALRLLEKSNAALVAVA